MKALSFFVRSPPYHRPSGRAVMKKTWMRVRSFLIEAIPFVFLGVVIVNILYITGIIDILGDILSPVVSGIWGLPQAAAGALLIGFLRKDVAVGMLVPLDMSPQQLVIAVTILTIYFPCVATFVVLIRELGIRDLIRSTLLMIFTALIVGGVMRIILLGV